jgi:O-antigen/teichoic acid export membrane protein
LDNKLRSGLKLELAASFAGTGWAALMQLACIPAYIRFMGIESYGLVGFYLVMQAMLQILDLGLSPTMTREMARCSVQPGKSGEARDLVRTLESGYWLIGLVIGATILVASAWLAAHWIKAATIPVRIVMQAVMLMGVLAFFQWPISFYQGGLTGLRQQVLLNVLRICASTASNVGGVLILWLVSPSIRAFLAWQIAVNAVNVTALAFFLWKSLPRSDRAARFDWLLAKNVRNFAAGMTGIAIISLVLTQADKLLVSKLFSLQMFGYYALAWSVASGPLFIAGCVFNVIFPRMSALVSSGSKDWISKSYHQGSQLMAVLILPIAAVITAFSFQILRLWTGNAETAAKTAPALSMLMVGSAINAVLYLPYILQLAYGWTTLPFVAGLVSISVLVPLMFAMAKHFGLVGAASLWAVLNIVNMAGVVPIMHRRLLRGEQWKYYRDIGFPLLASVATVAIARFVFMNLESGLETLAMLLGLWLVGCLVAVLAAPQVREHVRRYFVKARPSYV